jgi:3-hydroxyisobutyrate dehydrogenase
MGRHMARRLVSAGHTVTVYDVRPEAIEALVELGGEAARVPGAVAAGAGIVFTSLPGPPEVSAVWTGDGGLLDSMGTGAVGIDLSTIGPDTARSVAAAAAARGVSFLDCPVSGGVAGAEAGTLCLMAGGERAAFDAVLPVLECIGDPDKIYYCGEAGSGTVCKLVNNLVSLSTNTVVAEAMTLGVKAGVDAEMLHRVLSGSTGNSVVVRQWASSVLTRNFEPGFMVSLAAKDLRLAHELAAQIGVPLPVTAAAREQFDRALVEGMGEEAAAAVAKLQERAAGVEIDGRRRG